MKNLITLLVIITVLLGCKRSSKQDADFIVVDVEASYPNKELILQDIVDVEYIPLETKDGFICQGRVMAVGKDIVVVTNRRNDGDIFFFDRTGKGIRKINRFGRGGEEYIFIVAIAIDDEAGEMFVNDSFSKRILVYDYFGKFKRSFMHLDSAMFTNMYNFDQKNLICYNAADKSRQSFAIISKQDGSNTKEIVIPYKEKKLAQLMKTDAATNKPYIFGPSSVNPITPCFNDWILADLSSDTAYRYGSDHSMVPFVARTPSIQLMKPEVFLFQGTVTDRYCFMEAVKMEFDFETKEGFPAVHLMYDKQERAIFRHTVYNGDFLNKETVNMNTRPVNSEISNWQLIFPHELIKALEEGKLKGRLKEIAAKLDDESNPVIMLFKHKKK